VNKAQIDDHIYLSLLGTINTEVLIKQYFYIKQVKYVTNEYIGSLDEQCIFKKKKMYDG